MPDDTFKLWATAIGLSIGPAVSNGLARFAYGLLLPSMQTDLGWTYAQAGWINTANAIGYLIGSLLAVAVVSRIGAARMFIWGMALTTLALLLSAFSRDIAVLSFWRVLAGIGGAPVFIAGGALASAIFADDKTKNAFVIAVYFAGGGLGMLATALSLPLFLEAYGPTAWPLGWMMLGGGSLLLFIPAFLAARASPPMIKSSTATRPAALPWLRLLPAFLAYFLFGLGYVIYTTFLVVWMRGQDADAMMIATTWGVMGVAVMASPFVWRPVLARAQGGAAICLTNLATGGAVLLPFLVPGNSAILLSAAVFGASFFMVPSAVTTFSRRNLPQASWGRAIALFTTIFSIGQIVGPVGAGYVTDLLGRSEPSLIAGGVILLFGAAAALLQKPLSRA